MKRILLAAITVLVALFFLFILSKFKPVAEKKETEKKYPVVEVVEVTKVNAPLVVRSQGSVEPVTSTTASAEVAGRILSVSENFVAGGEFSAGDELLVIDPADYKAALAQSEAAAAQAGLALSQARAKGEQAAREWQKIGGGREASDLVLQKPQLRAAEANLASAEATVAQALRNLERSKLKAPYNGRIQRTFMDVGSLASPGAPLAELYATDFYEVRLPLSLDDYAAVKKLGSNPTVTLMAEAGGETRKWEASVVRSEGMIDRASRSVYVVARLKREEGEELLVPGLFLQAEIHAGEMAGVARIPQKAFYENNSILIAKGEGNIRTVHFRDVVKGRTEGDDVLVMAGLETGDQVCITPLATPIEGMEIELFEGGAAAPAETAAETAAAPVPAADPEQGAAAGGVPQ